MELLDFIDFKVIFILVTIRLWMPVAKIIWRAVNPYPAMFAPPNMRLNAPEGPQLDDELESEEWAVWRIRRAREESGEELPPVHGSRTTPRLSRMSSANHHQQVGLKRSA